MSVTDWSSVPGAEKDLANRFAKLRDSRTGPVFFIEHGLSEGHSQTLLEAVAGWAKYQPLHSSLWRLNPLPLVVTATEVGYRYKGTGTDFWPKLESTLDIEIDSESRHYIRDLFDYCSELYRGIRPARTRWTSAFSLIAWPVTHALVPLEFHRQLASALANLRLSIQSLEDETLHQSIRSATGRPTARFQTFLEDKRLTVPVVRTLLGGETSEISQDTIERIAKDLEADSDARRSLKVARQVQGRLRSRVAREPSPEAPPRSAPEPEIIQGSLQLRLRSPDLLIVEVEFPITEGDSVDELRRALRRRRFAPRLWGVTTRIPIERLISGLPFAIDLRSIPDPDAPLFGDLDDIRGEPSILAVLSKFRLDFKLPLLFAANSSGSLADVVRGNEVSASREYWLLGKEGLPGLAANFPRLAIREPLVCHRLNPSESRAEQALWELGYRIRHGVSVSMAGAPPVSAGGGLPCFFVGDDRLVSPRRVHLAGAKVEFLGETMDLDRDLVRVRVPEGEHALAISTKDTVRTERFKGVEADAASPPRRTCWIELRSEEMTVQALLSGRVSICIQGAAPLVGLILTLELEACGQLMGVSTRLAPLPHVLHPAEEPWATLLDQGTRALLFHEPNPVLHVRVGSLVAESWTLEQRVQPCWWHHSGAGLVLESELRLLDYGEIPLSAPVSDPVRHKPGGRTDAVLFVPLDPDESLFGPTARFVTYCDAPDKVPLSMPRIPRPGLGRSSCGGTGSVGVEQLVVAWLRWTLARTESTIAAIRKGQVASTLDSWLAEISCGEEWAQIESEINPADCDPWKLLADECRNTRVGLDDFVELSQTDEEEVIRSAVAEIRRTSPELWHRLAPLSDRERHGQGDLLNADDYSMLDGKFEQAYQWLAQSYKEAGKIHDAETIAQVDPGTAADQWDFALDKAKAGSELRQLAELLFPTDTALWLMDLDPTLMPLGEIAEELHRWAESSRAALVGEVPSVQVLKAILALWIEPNLAIAMDWRGAVQPLVTDRTLSRATRYLALRARGNREGITSP